MTRDARDAAFGTDRARTYDGWNAAHALRTPSARRGGDSGVDMTIGIICIVAGVVLLLDSLGVLHDVGVAELWPIAVIAIGISIVYNQVRRSWRRR